MRRYDDKGVLHRVFDINTITAICSVLRGHNTYCMGPYSSDEAVLTCIWCALHEIAQCAKP